MKSRTQFSLTSGYGPAAMRGAVPSLVISLHHVCILLFLLDFHREKLYVYFAQVYPSNDSSTGATPVMSGGSYPDDPAINM